MAFHHCLLESVTQITAAKWQQLMQDKLFASYDFLRSLEQGGCIDGQSGWLSMHLAVYDDEQLVAIVPGYLKTHSYGEYVFDWAIAEAYQQYRLPYYPKWVAGIPFTPVSGVRIGHQYDDETALFSYIRQALNKLCESATWSAWHLNFCTETVAKKLATDQLIVRRGVQFQWVNRGYADFDAFLQSMTSRKRKQIKKERQQALAGNFEIRHLINADLSAELMAQFYGFYCRTYLKRSGHQGYLSAAFFQYLLTYMRDHLLLVAAFEQGEMVAASLFLYDDNGLYGRYWGALSEFDCLHFELCYYQGIEFCLKQQIPQFNAGAQGEHKLARGFEPIYTYSVHHWQETPLLPSISAHFQQEWQHMAKYHGECVALLPFKHQ